MAATRAVFFDLGGTLMAWRPGLRPEEFLAGAAPHALSLLPPEQAAGLAPAAVGRAVRRAYLELEEMACNGDTRPMPGELCVQRGLEHLGVAVDAATAAAMLEALYVSERETTELLPHAEETLQALALAGLRLGVISNRMHGGERLLDDLGYLGISHFFTCIITSCEAGRMKPHPALFHQALAALGVTAAEAVMVGDDPRADVGGALASGLRAVWVRRPPERADEPPPGVPAIARLDELPEVIAAMHAG
jgi:HAD superfamily hydrolase (TIGR01509 family)